MILLKPSGKHGCSSLGGPSSSQQVVQQADEDGHHDHLEDGHHDHDDHDRKVYGDDGDGGDDHHDDDNDDDDCDKRKMMMKTYLGLRAQM